RAVNGGVDADQPPGAIEQGPAGIPRVDGRVRLDHVLDQVAAHGFDLPAQGADNAPGDRVIEPVGIADGKGALADLQIVRRADQDRVQLALGGVDVQNGDVLVRKRPHQAGVINRLIRHADLGRAGVADDVKVGDDVPVLVPDEAG